MSLKKRQIRLGYTSTLSINLSKCLFNSQQEHME